MTLLSHLRLIALTSGLACVMHSAIAQKASTVPAVVPAQAVAAPLDAQWEYLVVTYGKTVFGDPEKTLAYRAIGLAATAQEANEVQRSLDVLGRFGWEIITIVGSIGGDQQIVFKRRYDRHRVANEATAILKGKEIYLKDLVDILEREKRVREEAIAAAQAERSRPRLIELDEQDAEAARVKASAERLAIYTSALATVPWGSKAMLSVRASQAYTAVDLRVDVTEQSLQDGNAYRKSDVTSWLKKSALPTMKAATVEKWGTTFITSAAVIVFQGRAVEVGKAQVEFSRYSGWSEPH